MNILLDTNIVLGLVRVDDFLGAIRFINPNNTLVYLSIVSEAEIKSLAVRKKWGAKRNDFFNSFLSRLHVMDVNQRLINIYTEIDTYSQRQNPNFNTYPFDTPRNMGKNDLWIASLAALLGLQLVTTDADFDHLHNVFFDVRKINAADFLPFFQ